jgi:hypothetical protein
VYFDIDYYRAGNSVKGLVVQHSHGVDNYQPYLEDGRSQFGGWCLSEEVHAWFMERNTPYEFYWDARRETWYIRIDDPDKAILAKLTW